jgi:sulfur carrier protein ThiS
MNLKIKLYASLTPYLPKGTPKNEAEIEIPKGATVQSVLDGFNMPEGLYKLVLVNGVFITPEDRASRIFVENDVFAVWPPVAGG